MLVNKNNKIAISKLTILLAFLTIMAFLFALWAVMLVRAKKDFSIISVLELHSQNPLLFLAGLLPVVAVGLSLYSRIKMTRKENELLAIIHKNNKVFENYAEQAKKLGTGDHDITIETEGPHDRLGNALLVIQAYLRSNKRKEKNLAWINEGKDHISYLLRKYTQINELSWEVLKTLIDYIGAVQGAMYLYNETEEKLVNVALHAYNRRKYLNQEFRIGEGLVGECAYEMDYVYRTEIPDDYVTITSGIIGDKKPSAILLIPLTINEVLKGVLEFAFTKEKVSKLTIMFLLEMGEIIGRTINNLQLTRRTEILLEESRKMTEELKQNEQKLQENASIMEKTQEELRKSNEQLEKKILEVQNAQGRIHWLLENSSEVISIYNEEFKLVFVSPSVTRILGYTQEEMMQGKDLQRMSMEGARHFKEFLEQAMKRPDTHSNIRYSFIKKDGEMIHLESSARNFLNDTAINGIIINSRDITEKMRAEKEERLKTRMQSLSENSLDLIMRISTSGQFYYLNPVVEDYINHDPKSIINNSLSELDIPATLREYLKEAIHHLTIQPQKLNSEIPVPLKMGEKISERIISFDAIPEFSADELETILFVGHDITEAKRIEKEIQFKNKNIEDSINYARRIQSALLPDLVRLSHHFPRSYVFYKPRDVVSGDFPWFFAGKDYLYVAAIDCTGHGVPGALLSFIGYFILNNIVEKDEKANLKASEILDRLHENVRLTLKQDIENSNTRDGMDIAFCKINLTKSELQYAGAYRPLLILSEGELTEIRGDRKAIGGILPGKKIEEDFTNHTIRFSKGDKIFIYTDGLSDQLGGPYGRKYASKRIRDLILENPGYTMKQYHDMFREDFSKWQQGFKQLDDLLMIGIQF